MKEGARNHVRDADALGVSHAKIRMTFGAGKTAYLEVAGDNGKLLLTLAFCTLSYDFLLPQRRAEGCTAQATARNNVRQSLGKPLVLWDWP